MFNLYPGYYEWNLFFDSNFVYSFGDITELFEDFTKESIKETSKELVEILIEESKEENSKEKFGNGMQNKISNLSYFEIKGLEEMIANILIAYYAD